MKTKQTIAVVLVCLAVLVTFFLGVSNSGFFDDLFSGVGGIEPYVSVIYISGTIGETYYDIFAIVILQRF